MSHKAFSKAWRQELIRTNSKARVVTLGKFPPFLSKNEKKPFDPIDRQVRRLAG